MMNYTVKILSLLIMIFLSNHSYACQMHIGNIVQDVYTVQSDIKSAGEQLVVCHGQTEQILEQVEECGAITSNASDMWRNSNGEKSARLENGQIVLTYQFSGCPDPGVFRNGDPIPCETFEVEALKAIELLQNSTDKIKLIRVESNANIRISYGLTEGAFGRVNYFNENGELEQLQKPSLGEGFKLPSSPERRTNFNTLNVNSSQCLWIDDPEICRFSTGKLPSIPPFKTLILHEMMHSLGFKHTLCSSNGSIIGPFGGHGDFIMNDFDKALIDRYYSDILDSYKNESLRK